LPLSPPSPLSFPLFPSSFARAFLQGLLTLTNGTTIEGSFSGYWHKRIEINRGLLEDGERYKETADTIKAVMAELQ